MYLLYIYYHEYCIGVKDLLEGLYCWSNLKTLLTRRHQRLKLLEFFSDNKMAIEVKKNCQYSISRLT